MKKYFLVLFLCSAVFAGPTVVSYDPHVGHFLEPNPNYHYYIQGTAFKADCDVDGVLFEDYYFARFFIYEKDGSCVVSDYYKYDADGTWRNGTTMQYLTSVPTLDDFLNDVSYAINNCDDPLALDTIYNADYSSVSDKAITHEDQDLSFLMSDYDNDGVLNIADYDFSVLPIKELSNNSNTLVATVGNCVTDSIVLLSSVVAAVVASFLGFFCIRRCFNWGRGSL